MSGKESDHRGANTGDLTTNRNRSSKNANSKERHRRTRSPEAAPPAASPPYDSKGSAQLLLAHYAGDPEAFEKFAENHMAWMHNQLRKLEPYLDLDDVIQPVLVRIYMQGSHVQRMSHAHHPTLHDHAGRSGDDCPGVDTDGEEISKRGWYDPEKGSVRAWLYTLLWNKAISELRMRKRIVSFDDDAHGAVHHDHVVEEMEVREHLHALSERERRVIEGREAGETYEQIAKDLHCSITTVFNILHRLQNNHTSKRAG